MRMPVTCSYRHCWQTEQRDCQHTNCRAHPPWKPCPGLPYPCCMLPPCWLGFLQHSRAHLAVDKAEGKCLTVPAEKRSACEAGQAAHHCWL